MMTYKETIEYLYNQMPMFERQGATGYKAGLQNTLILDEHFGHPHKSYKTIHIAGTNGKGSCSHSIAAFLQECGYKVGLYTSPHLKDFSERIRVNGNYIAEEYIVDFVENERQFFEPLHPSFFELTTALAFKYFQDMNVDIAVIEVGLGGRLDCTNIITPIMSIITNIGFDHMQFLGNTLPQIAKEKAGIIKPNIPVIVGEDLPETRPVFIEKAHENNAPIIFAQDNPEVINTKMLNSGIEYQTKHFGTITGELSGIYQKKNTNTILTAIKVLIDSKSVQLNIANINHILNNALGNVTGMTGLMGRWQKIQDNPTIVCDTGHNVDGWRYLSEQIKKIKCHKLHIVLGFVNDKDVENIISLVPQNAQYYFTKPSNKRALQESTLMNIAKRHGLSGDFYQSVSMAVQSAKHHAKVDDFIFIGGSSYVVADFLSSNI